MTATDILGCTGVAAIVGVLLLMRLILTAMVDAAIADATATAASTEPDLAPALPADTLIEIGDAVFTAQEVSKIADLATYYQGRPVRVMTGRGQRTGGDAA